jgi:hypothetical protein
MTLKKNLVLLLVSISKKRKLLQENRKETKANRRQVRETIGGEVGSKFSFFEEGEKLFFRACGIEFGIHILICESKAG